jgi:putative PIN family toxin of toxin-antitoxin system
MLQLVVDTNVLVAGLRSKRGASFELIRLLAENRFRLNISVALALEYEDVLKRPGLVTGISETEIDAFLDYVLASSTLLPSVSRVRPSLRDPDDERILEVAVQCGATIVTHNASDFAGATRFGIGVKTPLEILVILRSTT